MSLHDTVRREAPAEEIEQVVLLMPESVRERDEDRALPIHAAVQVGLSREAVQCLARPWPESVLQLDRKGGTVLHFVGPMSFLPAVEFLVGLCPELLQVRNANGQLPLHSAAQEGARVGVLQFLAAQYPQALNEHDYQGYLPVHHLFGADACLERIRLFVNFDQPYNARETHPQGGRLTVHNAVRHKCPIDVIDYFYEMCPGSIQGTDDSGRCALYHHFDVVDGDVVDYGSDDVLEFLLEQWTDPVSPLDNNGNTVLHHAVQGWATLAAVERLVQRWPGAVWTRNDQGLLPLQCALAQEDPSIELLGVLVGAVFESLRE
jgi:ankyrin repeat protein